MIAEAMNPMLPLLPILFVFFLVLPVALLGTAFWIWMIISAVQNKGLTDSERVAWVLVVALLQLLGAIIYFFAGHSKRNTPLPA
jgi:pilus assembly protein TadC